jgi:hypothetical protein
MDLYTPPKAPLFLPPKPALVRAANLDSIRPWREAIEENRRLPYWKARQQRFRDIQDAMRKGTLPLCPFFMSYKQAPLSITYITQDVDNASASSYNFGSVSTGTANPLRWNMCTSTASGAVVTTGSTINGAAITQVAGSLAGIGYAYNPTGTTGTLSYTMSTTASYCSYAVYSIVGLLNGAPFSSVTGTGNLSLSAPKGGVGILAVRMLTTTAITATGTNYTENVDILTDSVHRREFGNISPVTADNASFSINVSGAAAIVDLAAFWAP